MRTGCPEDTSVPQRSSSLPQSAATDRTGHLGTRVGAFIAISIGSIVLTGWWLGIRTLKSGIPGYVTMKANTAAGLLLAGGALWMLGPEHRSRTRTRVGYGLAALCGLIGALTLVEYIGNPSWLHIDQILFAATEDVGRTPSPGRMAATSATGFVGVSLALLLLDARGRWSRSLGTVALAGAATIPLGVLVGYLYQVIPVGGVGQALQMALHTAAGFLALAGGIISALTQPW